MGAGHGVMKSRTGRILESILYVRKNLGLFKIRSDFHNKKTRSKHEIVLPRFKLAKTSELFLINAYVSTTNCQSQSLNLPMESLSLSKKHRTYYKVMDYVEDRQVWH